MMLFKDIIDPMYSMNDGIEDMEHYLLSCHLYDVQSRDLRDSVNTILF